MTAILYTKTESFKRDMQFRSTIERTIAALVRYHDARHARLKVSLAQADFQARMAATAYNRSAEPAEASKNGTN